MAAIARELDLLARSLDSRESDPVERLRAWCAAGEAYLLLGQKYALQCATEAFRYAEAAASKADACPLAPSSWPAPTCASTCSCSTSSASRC